MLTRSFFAPEVIQTSAMDCGPAALKSLLGGFGIQVNHKQLREACQTSADGTSLSALESVANQFGLEAEEILVPFEHLWLPEVGALPAVAVSVGPGGGAHFIVLWRCVAGRVQVMDPAFGRSWMTRRELSQRLLSLQQAVPSHDFRTYAASAEFTSILQRNLRSHVSRRESEALQQLAHNDVSWRSFGALDAGLRALESLRGAGALRSRQDRYRLLTRWVEGQQAAGPDEWVIPKEFWYAAPELPAAEAEEVVLRGVVVMKFTGAARPRAPRRDPSSVPDEEAAVDTSAPMSAPSAASAQPGLAQLLRLARAEGFLDPGLLLMAGILVAIGSVVEALMLGGFFELQKYLTDPLQRFVSAFAVLCFMLIVTFAEVPFTYQVLRLGSRLEARLRVAFLKKLPRLSDRYFQSRPISDTAERAHMVHVLRVLPLFALSVTRIVFSWTATSLGMIWLDPASTQRVLVGSAVCFVVPLLTQSALFERDARMRSLSTGLSRLYFDALSGLSPIRAHAGESSLHAVHESLLSVWKRAGRSWANTGTVLDLVVATASTGVSCWLFLGYLGHTGEPAGGLVFLFWALSFPNFGRELASAVRQVPSFANIITRLVEPLGALDAPGITEVAPVEARPLRAPEIEFEGVAVHAGGRAVLTGVQLKFEAGEHVAIVGASGAGKSTLLGLLLGWHSASSGRLLVNGKILSESALADLRREIVWLDPSVQLWNRSLLDNLFYGANDRTGDLSTAIRDADLRTLVGHLPQGLQTILGESGGNLSGGEGQRVRYGRALLHGRAGLALLDEPFRGLDRTARELLLKHARRRWHGSTLLCVTHDLRETLDFPRVIVVDNGKIIEDGVPRDLAKQAQSRFSGMLRDEQAVAAVIEKDPSWRRLRIGNGRVVLDRGGRPTQARSRATTAKKQQLGIEVVE